jgi:hypothetical protein
MKDYIFEIYLGENLYHATTNINDHQKQLDHLHANGFEPTEKRVNRGN